MEDMKELEQHIDEEVTVIPANAMEKHMQTIIEFGGDSSEGMKATRELFKLIDARLKKLEEVIG